MEQIKNFKNLDINKKKNHRKNCTQSSGTK